MAFTPARWARKARMCLNSCWACFAGSEVGAATSDDGTEYIFMLLSAEAVARRVMSGENLRHVIPRAWARGRVSSGVKVRDLGFEVATAGGEVGEAEADSDWRGEYVSDLDLDLDSDRDCRC